MNVSLYWIWEYIRVLSGYGFLMFIWPSVIFRRYLRGKSLTFRFSFCVTEQVVLVNTVVLMLGLFHLLHPWVFRLLFYGSFLWSAFHKVRIGEKEWKTVQHLLTGTLGVKQLLLKITIRIGKTAERIHEVIREKMKSHWWECFLLTIVVGFGMTYFSHGAFQDYSYGFGDMYPHNAWTYGLVNGQIFSAGVYPEAMHCFLYALHVLFGIRIYNCLLFLAGIHSGVYLLSAYVLLRQIFRWRYTPLFVLTLFLTVDVLCIDMVYSMSRLQWTLPQEFGLYAMFLCAAYLIRYSCSEHRVIGKWRKRKGKISRHYWDENLLVFMLALAGTLAIHFYVTIMAFFLCASLLPMLCRRVLLTGKRFVPLAAACVLGFTIAVVPMGGALLSGIPFQGSIGWAMNVINGTDPEQSQFAPQEDTQQEGEAETGTAQPTDEGEVETGTAQPTDEGEAETGTAQPTGEGEAETGIAQPTGEEEPGTVQPPASGTEQKSSLKERLSGRLQGFSKKLGAWARTASQRVWIYSYATLYRSERAAWILFFTALSAAAWLVCRLLIPVIDLILRKKRIPWNHFDHYFSLALASVIFMVLYNTPALGLPQLIAGSRLCSTEQMLNLAVIMVPFDLIFTVVGIILPRAVMKGVAACGVGGIYAMMILTGNFHGFLYFEFTRYNEAVMSTLSITQKLPENTYTIVSPVDELYQVIQYGWHEELLNFVNESAEENYTLPTEYVFLFIEKRPLQYGQSHFFTGPPWLACEKYAAYYQSYVSQCPDVASEEISEEYAADPRRYFGVLSSAYSNLQDRTVLESKMDLWCREFENLYPNELKVYYETDNFVCYYFRQNAQRLYQLAIMP